MGSSRGAWLLQVSTPWDGVPFDPSSAFRPPSSASAVQRRPHAQPRLLHHMCVDLRGLDALVPEQILHRADVHPALQQMRRKRVTTMPDVKDDGYLESSRFSF